MSMKITRRRFLLAGLGLLGVAGAGSCGYGVLFEPHWLRIVHLRLSDTPTHRLVHISDIHHEGDADYLARVVELVNGFEPDFVCFTGDMVSKARHLPGALAVLCKLNSPLYAVPGNWDYHCGADFGALAECCTATGGRWLVDEEARLQDGSMAIAGAVGEQVHWVAPDPGCRRLLLVHYPMFAGDVAGEGMRFDLILAGHSHGGQVRLPVIGALVVPRGVGRYDLGLYDTPAGPLYVNAGIGTSVLPLRFGCRPEITVIEI